MSFTERLRTVQRKKDSLLCVGLDADISRLPSGFKKTPRGVLSFLYAIIESTYDLVCAYKPNLAFFESLGPEGSEVLHKVLAFIPQNIITIGDGKRGDIGNTGEHYARALYDHLHFDAVTVSPYMGKDSVTPFLRKDKGVFLLALTSNAGSGDFQTKKMGSVPLYETVIKTSRRWDSQGSLGYVVGATHPAQLKRIRTIVPNAPLLIPGIGSQGGDLERSVQYGCSRDGDLAIINASRSILYASKGKNFAMAARREAALLRMAMEDARASVRIHPSRKRRHHS